MFVEHRKAAHPDPARDEAVVEITRQVRGYLDAGEFEDAAEVLADALELYPDDPILEAVSAAVAAARRRQVNLAAGRPNRRLPLFPLIAIALVIVAASGIFFLTRTTGQRFTYAEDAARTSQTGAVPNTDSLEEAVALAIRDHSWDEAHTWVSRLSELKPGDPKVKDWVGEIDRGSAADRKISDLRSAAQTAIRTRNWNEAETRIGLLLKEIPDDPDALEWRRLLSNGREEDLVANETAVRIKQVSALRASIPVSIQAKRWSEAQQRIGNLLLLVPDDAEAVAWQKALTILRVAELTSSASPALPPQPHPLQPGADDESVGARPPETISKPQLAVTAASPVETKDTAIANRGPAPILTALSTVPVPVKSSTPATVRLTSANDLLISAVKAVSGRWAYLDPTAPKPQKTEKGLVYAAELVSLDVDPDGSGELVYSLKKGALDGTLGTVQFHFWLKAWDGKKLSGLSDSADRDYSLTLEPGDSYLKLQWTLLKRPGLLDRRRATAGTAVLNRTRGH